MLQVPHLFAQVKCEIAYSRIAHYTGCEKTTLCTQNAGKTHESITLMTNKRGAAAEGHRPPLSIIFVIDSFVFMYILCILCVIVVHNVVFSQPV